VASIQYQIRISGASTNALHFPVMHVLALDFDGVLCDSSREVFVVAIDTYALVIPDSELLDSLMPLRNDALGSGSGYREHAITRRFHDLLPLGNRAEDFGVSLCAIEQRATIIDQEAYDAFYRGIGREWLDLFHQTFYECRKALRDADTSSWLQLHLPFEGLADTLRRHVDRTRLAVATAKDGPSVRLLLDELHMGTLFDPELIFDKESGITKTEHLRALHRRTGIHLSDITFVDDKVNHLVSVAELGVRPVLAAWGFNADREHRLARSSASKWPISKPPTGYFSKESELGEEEDNEAFQLERQRHPRLWTQGFSRLARRRPPRCPRTPGDPGPARAARRLTA
jgi:phosphoglycolate phosphatase-like HAD superfamily hydrolase